MESQTGEFLKGVQYCNRCCMPATNEGVTFDDMGICMACQSAEQKIHINWVEREKELSEKLESYKSKDGTNYDCLLPISGGKDSTFQMYVLTQIYGMKPLACTFSHNWYSETGKYNLENALEQFNVDHIMFTPNRKLVNKLARKSLTAIGDSCWHCHAGVGAFPLQVAVRFNVPLIVYGESICESSGRASYEQQMEMNKRDYFTKISAKVYPKDMIDENISAKDLRPFELPSYDQYDESGIEMIHLGDFIFWDDERQMEIMRDHFGWREDHVEGTYKGYKSVECKMPGMHDYTKFLKRGFGRATDHASFDIRAGLLTREEGLELAKKYDSQKPEALKEYLKITGFSEEEFYKIMESQRVDAAKKTLDELDLSKSPFHVSDNNDPKENSNLRSNLIDSLSERCDVNSLEVTQKRLQDQSASELIYNIHKGVLSVKEVVEHFAQVYQEKEKDIKAWVVTDWDKAIQQAESLDNDKALNKSLILKGLPVGIKDIFNTKHFPTAMGSALWKGFTPGNDARAVHYLLDHGAIIPGKTVTAEFAVHEPGETKNPHNLEYSPGTSSSGSAAAVAAGMVPLSIGTQTAGSIIRPASYCGIYGMKPSFGTLPRTGMLKTTDTLDQVGFFGRSIDDLELMFEIMRVRGSDFPHIVSKLETVSQEIQNKKDWKIGFVKTHTWDDARPYVHEAMETKVKELSNVKNIQVKEIVLPEIFSQSHEIHNTIYCKTLSYYFLHEFKQKEFVSTVLQDMIASGHDIDKNEFKSALGLQHQIYLECDKLFEDVDIIISHSTAMEAPRMFEQETKTDPCLMWSLAGLPVINLPLFNSPGNMPFGMQVVSKRYWDYKLLSFCSMLNHNYPIKNDI